MEKFQEKTLTWKILREIGQLTMVCSNPLREVCGLFEFLTLAFGDNALCVGTEGLEKRVVEREGAYSCWGPLIQLFI